jgi:uncharacterized DUF497 family protein
MLRLAYGSLARGSRLPVAVALRAPMTDKLTCRLFVYTLPYRQHVGWAVRFTWDEKKNQENQRDHQVSFELAREVFADPLALSHMDRVEEGEQRWQTMGMVGGMVILLVAHTVHEQEEEEVIRIISARKATKHERRAYEEG